MKTTTKYQAEIEWFEADGTTNSDPIQTIEFDTMEDAREWLATEAADEIKRIYEIEQNTAGAKFRSGRSVGATTEILKIDADGEIVDCESIDSIIYKA